MVMYEFMVLATVVLMMISALDYVRCAWAGKSHPVPATWILMLVVMGLSFWMYWESPRRSWTSNIAVTAGLANIIIILSGVIAANIRYGTLRVAFDTVQRRCLAGGAVVVAFWFLTNELLIAYVLVQCIALIAYAATVKRLWRAENSTEPIFVWVAVFLATICSLYPAWVKNDPFAWIYLARAVPSTGFVIFLILRIKKRLRRT